MFSTVLGNILFVYKGEDSKGLQNCVLFFVYFVFDFFDNVIYLNL